MGAAPSRFCSTISTRTARSTRRSASPAASPAIRSISATLNLNIYIGTETGVVGRIFITRNSNTIPGIDINGVFLLELNTFTTTKSVETFKVKKKTIFAGTADEREVFDGFERDAAGNLVVTTEQLGVVGEL